MRAVRICEGIPTTLPIWSVTHFIKVSKPECGAVGAIALISSPSARWREEPGWMNFVFVSSPLNAELEGGFIEKSLLGSRFGPESSLLVKALFAILIIKKELLFISIACLFPNAECWWNTDVGKHCHSAFWTVEECPYEKRLHIYSHNAWIVHMNLVSEEMSDIEKMKHA